MSIASADAALLSAARAYASLKMDQNSSSSASSSSNTLPPTSPISITPTKAKQSIRYSRKQLLDLANSPLCVRPEALKPLKDWFGDFEPPPFKTPQPTPTTQTLHTSFPRPQPSFQSSDGTTQLSSLPSPLNASLLPVLGRGQPPARNPFANFGKFGAEESHAGPLGLNNFGQTVTNQPNSTLKGARRGGLERDCAPHLARAENLGGATSDNQRRRVMDNSYPNTLTTNNIANSRDRSTHHNHRQNAEDGQESRGGRRGGTERLVQDRDRDEKGRTTGGGTREDNDEHPHWRRAATAAASNGSHQKPLSAREHIQSSNDSHREKDCEMGNRSTNRGRLENPNPDWGTDEHLLPNSDSVQPKQRAKDGAWDAGEGKWETKKSADETDAIQAWKAEMKAMDAKKKAAAAAAAGDGGGPEPAAVRMTPTEHEQSTSPVNIKLSEPEPEHGQKIEGVNEESRTTGSPAKTSHFASLLSVNTNIGFNGGMGADESGTRSSRFAKFFDSSAKDEHDGSRQQPLSGDSHFLSDETLDESGRALHRSASADPENMARVLSMLQMSSQSVESGAQLDAAQLLRQMAGSSQPNALDSTSYPSHQHPSPPKFNPSQPITLPTGLGGQHPSLAMSHGGYPKQDGDFTRRPTSVGNGLCFPPRGTSQHPSPVNQMRALEELLAQDQLAAGFGGQQTLPGQASMNALVQQMNLLGGRSKAAADIHLLGQQQQQQQERSQESQKLAFLARQLQQQRLSPAGGSGNAILTGTGVNAGQMTNRGFGNAVYNSSPIDHQRRFSGALQGIPPPPPPQNQLFAPPPPLPALYGQPQHAIMPPFGRGGPGPFGPPPPPPPHHTLPPRGNAQSFPNPFLGPSPGPGFNPMGVGQSFGGSQGQGGGQMDLMSLLNAGNHRRIGGGGM
ncbi:hypothetical protein CROQUDRAFT_658057 [Cronartium quercuum f. sp. fusiforme G11]|uniref:Uncharacterized protein n=1 Tax=Cronartium quercuum f. sp. fusiforme G11 TaxID=708437 RepID=A0A9P6NH79_9BASI|nr:hypothetical protein CROQUDRAFT_658057 [Cronartium quercuum f. sp. fusiforme G11]